MYQPVEKLNLGFSYRSEIVHNVHGKVEYDNVNSTQVIQNHPALGALTLADIMFDADAFARVNLPAQASLAVDYQLSPKLQLLASTTWTGWGAYNQLVVEFDNYAPDSESHQNFGDSWRYALGAAYQLTDALKLRTGVAFDNTPVPDKYSRSPRTPDADRKWFSLGMGYQINQAFNVDVGYTYITADKPDVEYTSTSSLGDNTLKGYYESEVNIFSAQLVWKY